MVVCPTADKVGRFIPLEADVKPLRTDSGEILLLSVLLVVVFIIVSGNVAFVVVCCSFIVVSADNMLVDSEVVSLISSAVICAFIAVVNF